jgi:rod shape-determining protein MreD
MMMLHKPLPGIHLILISLILTFMLDILPFPSELIWLRPDFTLLVLIYWILQTPDRVGIGWAFFVGLFFDLLTGTLLGEHALVFVCIAYFLAKFHHQLRVSPSAQRLIVVVAWVIFYKVMILIVQHFVGQSVPVFLYLLSIFTSIVAWLLIEGCLDRITQKRL